MSFAPHRLGSLTLPNMDSCWEGSPQPAKASAANAVPAGLAARPNALGSAQLDEMSHGQKGFPMVSASSCARRAASSSCEDYATNRISFLLTSWTVASLVIS